MYKRIIRPILFLFSPEAIHIILVRMIILMKWIPLALPVTRLFCSVRNKSLEREVFGIRFSNPVGIAAGFDKNGHIYNQIDAFGFGFTESGTITPKPQVGNPRPRIFRIVKDKAIINRMGFPSQGVKTAVKYLQKRTNKRIIIGGNIGKNSSTQNTAASDDYLTCFRALYDVVDYFVVNVSCPNVCNLTKLQNKDDLHKILDGIVDFRRGQNEYRPILLKISPDLTNQQLDDTIEVMKECNLDGIVAVNTTTSREGLTIPPEKIAAIGNGGMSGAPLTRRALEVVRYVHKKTEGNFPIIGVGGIMSVEDALAMLDAGASLIQVYTGFIYNGPCFAKRICKELIKRANAEKE